MAGIELASDLVLFLSELCTYLSGDGTSALETESDEWYLDNGSPAAFRICLARSGVEVSTFRDRM
jgi:hypothetical protein